MENPWKSMVSRSDMLYPNKITIYPHENGQTHITGWWCNNHFEKYDFVNGKDYISHTLWKNMENKSHVWNHQPDIWWYVWINYNNTIHQHITWSTYSKPKQTWSKIGSPRNDARGTKRNRAFKTRLVKDVLQTTGHKLTIINTHTNLRNGFQ